ncbi:MAG: TldD/PmbA family protein [Candidatus Aminicenantes bacterium]|nr:MAG: TldD/PmbA family protein [Candidatus Aminicenantes bacterium]
MKSYFKPITRRKFLKKGVTGGAVMATLPVWKLFSFSSPPSDFYVNPAVNLSKETLEKLIEIGLQKGGEFTEVYVEYNVGNRISLEENKIYGAGRGVDMGVGIRVLHGEKTGYAYCDDLSFDKLKQTAEIASYIAAEKEMRKPVGLKSSKVPSYYMVKVSPDTIVPQDKAKLLWKANSVGRDYDKKVNQVNVGFSDINKKIIIANSAGNWVEDVQTISRLIVSISAIEGDKRSRGYAYKGGTLGYENYDLKVAEELAKDAGRMAMAMLPAEDAPAGEYPIVMAKGHCGTFFHEAIGHSLESDGIRKKTSCFWDKKEKMIASEITSLADDGTVPGARGTINVDDEGTPAQNTVLIKNGKCINFIFDRLNAGLMKEKLTGNGRRESYQHYPLPRMTNTYLMAGKDDPEDIVKSVKKGIYISRIGGGNVTSVTGRFVFSVPEGYLIENGKVTKPLKGIQLMGSGPEVLKNIVMVGPDLEIWGGGTCGKSGQAKPCSDGNPTLKVSKITIGGAKV